MRRSQIAESVENLDSIDTSGKPFLDKAIVHLKSCWSKCQMVESNRRDIDLLLSLGESVLTYVATREIESAFVRLLPDALLLSSSRFGFLAEVCYNSADRPYLQSHAVTNIYKPRYNRRDILTNLQFHNLETLNGAILTSRNPVLSNRPQQDPRSGGVPFGHLEIEAFLGLPFLVGRELVGALALANCPDGYLETEIKFFSPLCVVSGLMISDYRYKN
ncbi:hypothetical protein CMK22_03360 [Candidatus Poribacteria bacterium]|nr:hypothetical protein [Candidatus Poribacteria bacterium]